MNVSLASLFLPAVALAAPGAFLAQSPSPVSLPAEPASAAPAAEGLAVQLAWGDYDADGLDDALAIEAEGRLRLLRSTGDGSLEDTTRELGLDAIEHAGFALWEDYDADGRLDLFVGTTRGPAHLLRNAGGVFVDVTAQSGLTATGADRTAHWIDYDGDGRLDLHLVNASENTLYHALPAGGFEPVELPRMAPAGGSTLVPRTEVGADTPNAGDAARTAGRTAGGRRLAAPSDRGRQGGGVQETGSIGGVVRAPGGAVNGSSSGFCAGSLEDQDNPGTCLQASSDPTLGMLYPLSNDLFVTSGGQVLVNATTSSQGAQLEVTASDFSGASTRGGIYAAAGDVSNGFSNTAGVGGTFEGGSVLAGSVGSTAGTGIEVTGGSDFVGGDGAPGIVTQGGSPRGTGLRAHGGNSGGTGITATGSGEASGIEALGGDSGGAGITATGGDDTSIQGGPGVVGTGGPGSTLDGYGVVGLSTFCGVFGVSEGIGVCAQGDTGLFAVSTGSNPAIRTSGDLVVLPSPASPGHVGIGTSTPTNPLSVLGDANFTGDVGIGTATPTNPLSVMGDANFTGDVGIGTATPVRPLTVQANGSGDSLGLLSSQPGSGYHLDFGSDHIQFVETGVAGGRLVLRDGGNVGIGTTAPAFRLEVNGSAGKPGGGSWSVSSDARLKKNVRDLDGALDTLLELRGVTFEYKDPAAVRELEGERLGFIAQEVEGYKRLTIRGFEALAVEALRELRAENTELHAQVEALHARDVALLASQAELRSENDALHARLAGVEALAERMAALEASLRD